MGKETAAIPIIIVSEQCVAVIFLISIATPTRM